MCCPPASTNQRDSRQGRRESPVIPKNSSWPLGGPVCTLSSRRRQRVGSRCPLPDSSTELPLLLHVRNIVGSGRITGKIRVREHHSPGYAFTVSSRRALAVLAQVLPYLRTYKAERARLLLGEYVALTPRNGKYTPALRAARAVFEERFFAIRVRAGTSRVRPSLKPHGDEC